MRMFDDADDDDTVPHAPRVVRSDGALAHDVANGDTVLRGSAQAGSVALPPLPAALRPHYRIRVSGEEVALERPVQIGRSPRNPRVPSSVRPELVTVASPEKQISASHVEFREQGAAVVVTDLRTRNGSEVHIPGAPVVSLRHGASLVVTAGARIDLGEGVVVDVLAPAAGAPK